MLSLTNGLVCGITILSKFKTGGVHRSSFEPCFILNQNIITILINLMFESFYFTVKVLSSNTNKHPL